MKQHSRHFLELAISQNTISTQKPTSFTTEFIFLRAKLRKCLKKNAWEISKNSVSSFNPIFSCFPPFQNIKSPVYLGTRSTPISFADYIFLEDFFLKKNLQNAPFFSFSIWMFWRRFVERKFDDEKHVVFLYFFKHSRLFRADEKLSTTLRPENI